MTKIILLGFFSRHSAVSCCARTTPDGDSVSSYCGWLLSSILYCRESAVSWRWWMSPWRSYEARRGTWPTEWRSWSTVSGLVQTQVGSCNRRAWETNTPELLQFNVVTNKQVSNVLIHICMASPIMISNALNVLATANLRLSIAQICTSKLILNKKTVKNKLVKFVSIFYMT